jgi:SAM-dependent methyltransferase
MSRLDEYIKRYEGLHTGRDDFRASTTGALIKVGETKELFTGIQFLRKFPKHLQKIAEEKGHALTLLDYGCGKGNMPWRPHEGYKNGLWGFLPDKIQSIYLYDPCYPPFSTKPPQGWQFDVVGCADVMEHIPEEDVDTVLKDLTSFCKPDGVLLFSISGNKAMKAFEDGENLHCTIRSMDWWKDKIESVCKRSYVLIHTEDSRDPAVDTLIGKRK